MSRFKLVPWVVLMGLATSAAAGSAAQARPVQGVAVPAVDNYGVTSYKPLPASPVRGQFAYLTTGARTQR